MQGLLDFLTDPGHWAGPSGIPARLLEHLLYAGITLGIAVAIAFPLGLLIGHTGRGAFLVINLGNAARALPTLGLLTIVVLFAGVGLAPVVVALVALAVPPVLTATYAGIRSVEPGVVHAARAIGMTARQVITRVELPVALPVILGGVRSAALQVVATATVAAYVALGGLGRFVIDGLAVRNYSEVLAGATLVAMLAITADAVFAGVQRVVVSPGITGRYRTGAADQTLPREGALR